MSLAIILLLIFFVLPLGACSYMTVCGEAQKWLTPRELWRRATCKHKAGVLLAIEFDGESVYECSHCKKIKRVPLDGGRGSEARG